MANAGIIIIGNEVLSGRTLDKNSNYICDRCSKIGIKVKQIRIIEDDIKVIIKNVLNFSKKFTYVFVTGGIGPTHDDKTAEAVASAFKRKMQINKKAKSLLIEHYKKSNLELNENRIKMAKIPLGARLILNPVSAAPGFKIKNVWVMAGVPKIMQGMFASYVEPKLKKSKPFISKQIIVYKPEGDIADLVEGLQNKYIELDVGSYPFYNPPNVGTNIIIRGRNDSLLLKASQYFVKILKSNDILYSISE